MIVCNTKILAYPTTGVQRVTQELLAHMGTDIECIAPYRKLRGITGHAWEQAILPTRLHGRLLWSPSNTGPLAVKHQVVTLHDTAFLDCPNYFSKKFVRAYRALIFPLLKRVRHVITVSEFSKRRIMQHYGLNESNISVIANGVSARFCSHSDADLARMRTSLQLPPCPYVLAQVTADGRKNLHGILAAWRMALPDLPEDTQLIITGTADLKNQPRVTCLGFIDDHDLPALYAGAGAFLFPSLYEGFGLPVLEAMASGIPVITSTTTSLPEVAGDAAMLVNPANHAEMARALVTLLNSGELRAKLSHAGLLRAARFTWDKAATETRRTLERFAV